ncbi:MAG: hypothetical protein A2Y33_15375 [Spirochaetes bacterium GWF1_51_8]|nr:MAG: hypothetical protein A2Y33_15375 [Spirochaetes bacterium GWF1_51_8]
MMKKEKTYYEILEIETSADKQIIKESFRKMSLRYHPDLNREPEMDYVIILEAYKTLIDDKKRDEYNHSIGLKIRIKDTNCGMTQIPPNRIEYCLSMKSMLDAGMKTDRRYFYTEMSKQLEQDIVVKVTRGEIREGSFGVIEIPSRDVCPVCMGRDPSCYRCEGLGFVKATEKYRFEVPIDAIQDDLYEIDFGKLRNKMNFWNMKIKKLRIRINVI